MRLRAYKHSRLMQESELRVEVAARSGSAEEMLVAGRVLEHPTAYRLWESEHDRLMRSVSEQLRLSRQVVQLRSTTFAMIHRKALFQYLRDEHVTGGKRHRAFALIYGTRDYSQSVIAEHGNYVRSSSSFLCTQYLAEQLMGDVVFAEALRLYEERYTEYFRIFCETALAQTPEEKSRAAPLEAIKPLLKLQLSEARQILLNLPERCSHLLREVQLRRATGHTQRLRVLFAQRS